MALTNGGGDRDFIATEEIEALREAPGSLNASIFTSLPPHNYLYYRSPLFGNLSREGAVGVPYFLKMMGNQEDEEFYRNLSRKELQSLCKKHGLPANTTNNQLAHSLVSYFQSNQKNANSAPSWERFNGSMEVFHPPSSVLQLEAVGEICKGTRERGVQTSDVDGFGSSHCSEEKDASEHLNSQTVKYNGTCGNAKTQMSPKASGATVNMILNNPSINGATEGHGCSTYDRQEITIISRFGSQRDLATFNPEKLESHGLVQARNLDKNSQDSTTDGGAGNSPQIQYRNPTFSVFSTENGLLSTETSIKAPPSFEFYVSSEEGINLYVDLNSSPSEWVESFTNEVCLFRKLKSLGVGDEKLKISSLWNKESAFQTKDDLGCPGPSPSSAVTNDQSFRVPHYPDITDESLRSCTTIPCRTTEISGVSGDDDPVLSSLSRPHSDEQMQMVSGTETCLGEGEMACLDLEISDASQKISASNSVLDTKLAGPNCPDLMKHQNSVFISTSTGNSARHSTGTCTVFPDRGLPVSREICKVSVPLNTPSFENPSEVCPGFSASVSMEMQLSEVGSQCKSGMNFPCQKCGLVNFNDRMHGTEIENVESANCEHDGNTCRNPPTAYTEAWEKSSIINDRESSECSQIDNSSERTCKRSHYFEYPDSLQSKRLHTNSVDQNGCTKPTGKNIRSSTHMAREVPSPRRSLRLVSKLECKEAVTYRCVSQYCTLKVEAR
ncbi:hypothetical protein NE237_012514 [Protea cynaroides]|uniref:SAP domain-containing protein n=1 Tax=Protea cynaroides TaxID=273540 RepID=A0A9Q0GWX2_9MAGN|nr:hypothetical protein NE237_012514 [Protea cynaroides]